MKKTVYKYIAHGTNGSIDIEILLDCDRELNNNDNNNLSRLVDDFVAKFTEESIRLNPESALQTKKERDEIISLFGNRAIYVEEIPNGYCSSYCCKHLPWFIVTTNKGRIKIGWRKRVINIDWSDSIVPGIAQHLFSNEDVTKGISYIHACGLEKAKEYIDILLA